MPVDERTTEQAGGVLLLVGATAALIWANSPWRAAYSTLWSNDGVHHAVNDGLMALFFLSAGLEIKRELVAGELGTWRHASLPAFAALGGMVVPALLYTAVNVGGPGARGWGVPMATDVAFAVGVLSLLGRRIPPSLRLFLLSLAVVDDLGAIVVIAVYYNESIEPAALAIAAGLLVAVAALCRGGRTWMPVYAVLAVGLWVAVFQSGVHATVAGAALGLVAPAGGAQAQRLERALQPVVSFVVLPLFALANAGVAISGSALDAPGAGRVALGVVLGLVVGKPVGVLSFSWLAVHGGGAVLPRGTSWAQLGGAAVTAGVGFTVSLFIAELAFGSADLRAAAKLGILAGSVLAAGLGLALLRRRAIAPVDGR